MATSPLELNQNPTKPYAWLAILGFFLLTLFSILARVSGLLNILFPLGALSVAVFLYFNQPILYLGFNWWIWILSPLIARIVEYQTGILQPGRRFIILSPYLVTLVAALTLISNFPRIQRDKDALPFLLALIAMGYSFTIGVVRDYSMAENIRSLLTWIPGLFLGFHCLVNWRDYPKLRDNIYTVFGWMVLFMGLYGIYQYVVAPPWDSFWLSNAEDLQRCCGWPEPFQLRVWSTLNFPFTFAYVMSACLLVLLSYEKINLFIISSVTFGLASFLLSQVRGAWIGFIIGLFILSVSLGFSQKKRLLFLLSIILILTIPLVVLTPLSEVVISRLDTLSEVQNDSSLSFRILIYIDNFERIMFDPVGLGMGGRKLIDAGYFDIFSPFGWVGQLAFFPSITLLIWKLFQQPSRFSDPLMKSSRCVMIGALITSFTNSALVLMPGVIFWTLGGLSLAGYRYYSLDKKHRFEQPHSFSSLS